MVPNIFSYLKVSFISNYKWLLDLSSISKSVSTHKMNSEVGEKVHSHFFPVCDNNIALISLLTQPGLYQKPTTKCPVPIASLFDILIE